MSDAASDEAESRALGIVLAGGLSRRMGRDKAALMWRGETLLDRARALLSAAGARRIVVLGREHLPDGEADGVAGGPARALEAAIARHAPNWPTLLVVPVDMPLLSAPLLQTLLRQAPAHYEGSPLPCALRTDIARSDATSLFALMRGAGARVVQRPSCSDRLFSNINTPADLNALTQAASD